MGFCTPRRTIIQPKKKKKKRCCLLFVRMTFCATIYIRKTHRLLSVLFCTFSHFFMLFIRKVEKAMSSTCQNAFRVAQKSRWPFKSKESIVAWKSTCILTKVKQKNIKYSTELVIVVAVRRRWWCPSLSVVSGGCPSPCVTVGPQWWSSIAVVVGGPRWWLSITIRRRWWSCSLCIIVHRYLLSLVIIARRNPSPSPSPSVISHCCPLSVIIVGRRCQLSLSVFVVGLRRWLSSLVVSHHHRGCRSWS